MRRALRAAHDLHEWIEPWSTHDSPAHQLVHAGSRRVAPASAAPAGQHQQTLGGGQHRPAAPAPAPRPFVRPRLFLCTALPLHGSSRPSCQSRTTVCPTTRSIVHHDSHPVDPRYRYSIILCHVSTCDRCRVLGFGWFADSVPPSPAGLLVYMRERRRSQGQRPRPGENRPASAVRLARWRGATAPSCAGA